MSEIEPSLNISTTQPKSTALPEPATAAGPSATLGRLVGVDLARALAVFGMFVVHVGPKSKAGWGPVDWLLELAEGRASTLFATLAGFSLMFIVGRQEPKTGTNGRQAKIRVVVRAVILLAVGSALSMTSFGPAVIINYYGVYFLLALPLARLRAKALGIVATGLAVVAPPVAFGLRALLSESFVNGFNAYDPLERLCGVGVLDLLLTGFYPAVTWMPFVIAGMAIGRLDLATRTVQRRLAALGVALTVVGYGLSWLLLRMLGGESEFMAPPADSQLGSGMKDLGWGIGSGPFDTDRWLLLAAEPHSGSTFDVLGTLGIAIVILVGSTVVMARLPWLRRLASPVVAVGTMSLTIYVAHVLAIVSLPGGQSTPPSCASLPLLMGFIAGATLFATVWSQFFRRGPLEYLLAQATKVARLVR